VLFVVRICFAFAFVAFFAFTCFSHIFRIVMLLYIHSFVTFSFCHILHLFYFCYTFCCFCSSRCYIPVIIWQFQHTADLYSAFATFPVIWTRFSFIRFVCTRTRSGSAIAAFGLDSSTPFWMDSAFTRFRWIVLRALLCRFAFHAARLRCIARPRSLSRSYQFWVSCTDYSCVFWYVVNTCLLRVYCHTAFAAALRAPFHAVPHSGYTCVLVDSRSLQTTMRIQEENNQFAFVVRSVLRSSDSNARGFTRLRCRCRCRGRSYGCCVNARHAPQVPLVMPRWLPTYLLHCTFPDTCALRFRWFGFTFLPLRRAWFDHALFSTPPDTYSLPSVHAAPLLLRSLQHLHQHFLRWFRV